jgi:hypothetical protein
MKCWVLVIGVMVCLAALSATPTGASEKTCGELRALKRRAATVIQQKNDFVARVLHSHKIVYQRNEEGNPTSNWQLLAGCQPCRDCSAGAEASRLWVMRSSFTQRARSSTLFLH